MSNQIEAENTASRSLGSSTDDARKEIVIKVIQFSTVWLYALHEVASALSKYADPTLGYARFGPDVVAHALDEAWGSLEDCSLESGELDDAGLGYGPYILAGKRCEALQIGGYVIGNGGAGQQRGSSRHCQVYSRSFQGTVYTGMP